MINTGYFDSRTVYDVKDGVIMFWKKKAEPAKPVVTEKKTTVDITPVNKGAALIDRIKNYMDELIPEKIMRVRDEPGFIEAWENIFETVIPEFKKMLDSKINYERGDISILEKSFKNNPNPSLAYQLGLLYLLGDKVQKSNIKALDYFEYGAYTDDRDDPSVSICRLMLSYMKCAGKPSRDMWESLFWFAGSCIDEPIITLKGEAWDNLYRSATDEELHAETNITNKEEARKTLGYKGTEKSRG